MKKLAVIGLSMVLVTGCVPTMQDIKDITGVKKGTVDNTVTGSAGKSGSQNADTTLKKCDKPLGVAALVEPESTEPGGAYAFLKQHYKLPNPIPMLKLMMAQSGCFQVVDRGAASKALQRERELSSQGELASNKNTSKGQMVSADWVITPEVIFQDESAGGGSLGGGVGALFGPIGMAIGSAVSIQNMEAQTMLTAVSVKTGIQEAIAEGSAEKKDIGVGGFGIMGGAKGLGAVGGGAYQSTDIGKIVLAAFMDAHNKLVDALR